MNYERYLNDRAKAIPPSGIRRFFDVVEEIEGAISLGVGEPDFATPWVARDAAIKSIQRGYTQYTSNAGLKELRELIARYLSERMGLSYDPLSEIIVTVGASEGIDLGLRVLLSAGDEVLVPDPSYVSYAPCVTLGGGVPVPVACSAESEFKLTRQALEAAATPRAKALILPYPNNPTGAVMEREYLEDVAAFVKERDLIVLSDEIYAELTYGERHVSFASLPGMAERTMVINGFSKAFAMTGWRLGYIAAPEGLCRAMLKVHQYAIMCAPTAAQYAGIAALKQGFSDGFETVGEMREEYDKRRRFMVKAFNDMGLETFTPRGAFYVFPSVAKTGMDGEAFAEALLAERKVAVVPGSAFGPSGKDFVRCSYAYSMKSLDRATEKIAAFVRKFQS